MKDTKTRGDACEGIVMAVLLQHGKKVLVPFGENRRYDLALDEDGKLVRIQCKSGKLSGGVIRFNTCSTHYHRGGGMVGYRGEADMFGVFCPQNGKIYLVPVQDMPVGKGHLRVEKSKNNQEKKTRLASQYEIAGIAQVVEHHLGKMGVGSSTLLPGSTSR